MELSLPHTLHLFNIFRQYDGKENCAQVLEEECIKMFGTKSLNDEHDYNVVSMNSLNIHITNDYCTSHDKNVSYEHVNFCGVHWVCWGHKRPLLFGCRVARERPSSSYASHGLINLRSST